MGHSDGIRKTMITTDVKQLLNKTYVALGVGVCIFIASIFYKTHITDGWSQIIWLCLGGVVLWLMWYTGRHFFIIAWISFKKHHANMNLLVALSISLAWAYSMLVAAWPNMVSYMGQEVILDAPMLVIGFLNLGAALELIVGQKTQEEAQHLLPDFAKLIENKKVVKTPIAKVKVGSHLLIDQGDIIPMDGKVIKGHTRIDEIILTGEDELIGKSLGDSVFAGTLNHDSKLIIEVDASVNHFVLKKVVNLVSHVQSSKSYMRAIVENVGFYFTPCVMIIALVSSMVWMNFGPSPIITHMVFVLMSVLLIACPSCLALAVPISCSVGISKAAKSGIIFKNSEVLSALAKVDVIIMLSWQKDAPYLLKLLDRNKIQVVYFSHENQLPDNFNPALVDYFEIGLSHKKIKDNVIGFDHSQKNIALITTMDDMVKFSSFTGVVKICTGIKALNSKYVDVIILRESYVGILNAIEISRTTLRNIMQNLYGAIIYNCVAISIAAGILYPFFKLFLNPILAGAFMAVSSLAVILNTNRLLKFTPSKRGLK
jgi:cation transport ATPase